MEYLGPQWRHVVKGYRNLLPCSYDKSFLQSVVVNHPELLIGEAIKVTYKEQMTTEVSSKSYQIQFETGSSVIKSASFEVLDEILKSAIVAEGLKVGIYGHTDNVGNQNSNQILSEERALSVKNYLIGKGLPVGRIESKGLGSTQPIAENTTSSGKAKNRRVQIVLGE